MARYQYLNKTEHSSIRITQTMPSFIPKRLAIKFLNLMYSPVKLNGHKIQFEKVS